jgi:hypothetical protein
MTKIMNLFWKIVTKKFRGRFWIKKFEKKRGKNQPALTSRARSPCQCRRSLPRELAATTSMHGASSCGTTAPRGKVSMTPAWQPESLRSAHRGCSLPSLLAQPQEEVVRRCPPRPSSERQCSPSSLELHAAGSSPLTE